MSVPPIDLLPDALRERTTALNRQPVDESAAFVLYWMRTSVRGHENPALVGEFSQSFQVCGPCRLTTFEAVFNIFTKDCVPHA